MILLNLGHRNPLVLYSGMLFSSLLLISSGTVVDILGVNVLVEFETSAAVVAVAFKELGSFGVLTPVVVFVDLI